ncbi:hypothetical protein like AT3G21570 [Hibiscus trionum]|uniref:Uncharacterized protein n=1 Tax=Hibiscus trionum TaxID=183268 RepID=A0A9W7JDY3_HIBTR|nr:hypothetical protein like AT3G21570 [Hibiscus trionum]
MGTEVLWPQDCLNERFRVSPVACSRRRYGNGGFNPSCYGNGRIKKKSVRRKRVGSDHAVSKRSSSDDALKVVRNNVGKEKVTILRRGELLDSKIKRNNGGRGDKSVVTGLDPETISKQIKIVDIKSATIEKSDVYAGSAFAVSPAPSSLPLPSFSKKKQISIDDSATRDLRRLLRLDI